MSANTGRTDRIIQRLFLLNGLLVVGLLAGIFVLLVLTALPGLREINLWDALTGAKWNPTAEYTKPVYGMGAMFMGTFLVTIGAMLIAIPFGLGTAAFLTDIASGRFREVAKPVIEILASIPSVVLGFFGIVVIGPMIARVFGLSNGLTALNGSILLAVMALPTIISLSEDALKSVPATYSNASLALGATRWQTLLRVKIPSAMSGIFAACLLGMGRAIGETMTVLMATGCASYMPHSFFDAVRTMTAAIAIELGEVPFNTTHYYALFGIALVLFCITFIINLIAELVLHRQRRMLQR